MRIIVYIITIKKNRNELNNKINLLEKIGFNVIIINGVNGYSLSSKEYFDKIKFFYSSRKLLLTPGEIGCCLSHLKCSQLLSESEYDFALVLEDDAIINQLKLKEIYELCSKAINGKTLIHLGGNDGLKHKIDGMHGELISCDLNLWRVSPLDYGKLIGTVGYLISKSAAKEYYKNIQDQFSLADDYRHLNSIICFDALYYSNKVSHPLDPTISFIHDDRKKINMYANSSIENMNFRKQIYYIFKMGFTRYLNRIKYRIKSHGLRKIDLK